MLCDEDECVTTFQAYFDLPVNGGTMNMSICMTFEDNKDPEGLESKEF